MDIEQPYQLAIAAGVLFLLLMVVGALALGQSKGGYEGPTERE